MIERFNRFVGVPSFHRGLALGALVGAAIAGSTLWTRLRESHQATRDRNAQAAVPGQGSPKRDLEG